MRRGLFLLFLFAWVPYASAAVTFDAASSSSVANAPSITWSHTVGGGCTNAVLLIGVNWQDGTVTQSTSVTYNGVGATLINRIVGAAGGFPTEFWRLLSPTLGSAQNIVVTLTDNMNSVAVGSVSYCGVDQTTPFGTPVSATSDSTPITIAVASATGALVVDVVSSFDDSFSVGAGQTQRVNIEAVGSASLGMSDEAGATSVTMSWTQSPGTQYWNTLAVSLNPAAGAASPRRGGPIIFGAADLWQRMVHATP